MRRLIFPLVMGFVGLAILLNLGAWQVRRLAWKEVMLAEIASAIAADPAALPAAPETPRDDYLSVNVSGTTTGQELDVLTPGDEGGAAYRIVAGFVTDDGRKIMVELGQIPDTAKGDPRPATALTVTGNLFWPRETDKWTAAPDPANIWYARDVDQMAQALGTEPVLVVARAVSANDLGLTQHPVDTAAIPNNHLNYAITWFLMAAAWAGMTGYLVIKTIRRKE